MERHITEKEIEQIINLGALGYTPNLCSEILGWEQKEIEYLLKNKESVFYKNFQKGEIRAQYVIDLKLFELAQQGDIKALDKLELRKKLRK